MSMEPSEPTRGMRSSEAFIDIDHESYSCEKCEMEKLFALQREREKKQIEDVLAMSSGSGVKPGGIDPKRAWGCMEPSNPEIGFTIEDAPGRLILFTWRDVAQVLCFWFIMSPIIYYGPGTTKWYHSMMIMTFFAVLLEVWFRMFFGPPVKSWVRTWPTFPPLFEADIDAVR